MILDEATSSLDLPTERLVQQALDTLLADRTAVIIAHRLSTVEIADRVLVVDDGRIVADGPPERSPPDAAHRLARYEQTIFLAPHHVVCATQLTETDLYVVFTPSPTPTVTVRVPVVVKVNLAVLVVLALAVQA